MSTTMTPAVGGAQGSVWWPGQPLVSVRALQVLTQGLGARFHQVASPRGAARSAGWKAVATLCAASDVGRAVWLARTPGFWLAPRLAADAGDLALWCMAAGDDPDSSEDAVVPGAALAVEAGARLGWAGLVVPAVNTIVVAAVRTRRGHRLRLYQLSWQVLGVVAGRAFARLIASRSQMVVDANAADMAARIARAELEGLNEVLLAHEGPLDLLQRADVLVELGRFGSGAAKRADVSAAVKAAVAEAMRDQACYLADTLAGWQAAHNSGPRLSQLVAFDLEPGSGTVVLSPSQAGRLVSWLDRTDLTGLVPVRLVDAEAARRPFGGRELLIDDVVVDLPPDSSPALFRLDALPAAFLLNLGWLTAPTGAHREAVPWSATAGPLFLGAALMLWSARRGEATPAAAALAGSFGTTLWYIAASSRAMANPHTDAGVSRYPWVMPLQGYELVRTLAAGQIGRRGRVAGLVGTAVAVAAGWALSPPPRSARALVAELIWPAGFAVLGSTIRRALARAEGQLAAASEDADAVSLRRAHRRGEDAGRAIITQQLQAARARLEEADGQLDPDLAAEAARRLSEVEAAMART